MATVVWPRIRAAIARPGIREQVRSSTSGQDQGVRRVAVRLATQTVVLLLVMLIALEVVVFLITRQALLGSLQTTLQQRANQWDPTVCHVLPVSSCPPSLLAPGAGVHPAPGDGKAHGLPRGGSAPSNVDTNPSEAAIAYLNSRLRLIHADGALSKDLLDEQAAQQALSSHQPQWRSVSYQGEDYLVYTVALRSTAGNVVGVAQASISEHQYKGTMHSLLQALILVALLGLITSGGISAVLVRRSLQPIRLSIKRQRDFVADAAHELRTPLAIQRTVAEVGLANPDSSHDELQGSLEQVLGENRHLTRLVEDLSLLARADTDAVSVERRPVDLSRLVTDTADEIGYLAGEKEIALNADVQGKVSVLGDIVRLRQLILILLDNALKHTPPGGCIRVRLSGETGRVRLEVADSGPGIDPADLVHIFDRFYRADRSRSGEGTGLGLAIAKWIVEAHGGQIQAANVSPHGALFTVVLPLVRTAPTA